MHALGSLRKYLIYLSYIGHEFRGIQKQKPSIKNGKLITVHTVQEELENSINFVFKPMHNVTVFSSSRTDAGVHALRTSVHLYLQLHRDIRPDYITSSLNKHFVAENIGIRIQNTCVVPEWFHARFHAISRTYVYRFAFRKKPLEEKQDKHLVEIPFSEYGRTFFIQTNNLDIEKMREAAALFPGTKDFFSFMGKPTRHPEGMTTIRSIYSLTLSPSQPFMADHDPPARLYNYWEVTCHGRSFLYRQVRRMVGVLIAVGRGALSLHDVRRLLHEPSPESWDPRAVCVPPWGLYLLDVTYNPLNLRDPDDDEWLTEGEKVRTTQALYF